MEHYGKNPRYYRGLPFFVIFLVLPPILIFLFVYFKFAPYNDAPKDVVVWFSILLSTIIGSLINVISIMKGLIGDLIKHWFDRIKEFFEDVRITPKGAFKSYFFSFYHDGGIILVIFFLYWIALIILGVIGFINVRAWFLTLDPKLWK